MNQQDLQWNNYDEPSWDESMGIPVVPVYPFPEMLDFEWLLLSLSADHAKIVLIRHFGLSGKKAAKAGGFSSEWTFYRKQKEFKKVLDRKREHFFG